MATERADQPRRLLRVLPTLLAFVGALGLPSGEPGRAQEHRDLRAVWVDLPRSEGVAELDGYAAAPLPLVRAQDRRARRGDARAVAGLSTGPDADAVRDLAAMVHRVRFVSRWLCAAAVEVDDRQLANLRRRYGSGAVRPVRRWVAPVPAEASPVALPKRVTPDYGPSLLQNQQVQVDLLHDLGFTGLGVRVLALDTGFFTDLPVFDRLNVVDAYDFVFDDPVTADEPEDIPGQHTHGTRVLSVLAGFAPGELIGPAHGAELLLAKTENVDVEVRLEEDDFVAALEWGEALGADVATASLGYRSFDDGFTYPPEAFDGDTAVTTRAMDAAAALGLVCVVAAGNDGPDPMTLLTPADADSVLAVGAVDSTGGVRNFSSRGPTFDGRHKPDVCARGWLTIAALPDSGYGLASGTSAAAPLVAGAASLLLEGHPEWTAQDVVDALRSTATQGASPDDVMGYGIVQALDALYHEPPVAPFPFALIEPADGASEAGPGVTFRWKRAFDVQSPQSLVYAIQFSASASFDDTVGWWWAGNDTTRTLDFLPTGDFHWRVLAHDPQGHRRASEGRAIEITAATAHDGLASRGWVRFLAPAPNPFNPSVRLGFVLSRPAAVELELFDLAGRRILDRAPRTFPAGEHALTWAGTDQRGRHVSSGVYLVCLRASDGSTPAVEAIQRVSLVR